MKQIFTLFVFTCLLNNVVAQNIEWQKSFGGSAVERISGIKPTPDGGSIMLGYTASNSGDVSGNHGGYDGWVIKINAAGNIEWQKCYGGSLADQCNDIISTADGGYIMACSTMSTNGDVSTNAGAVDAWIVKINTSGNIEWQKTYGGSNTDQAVRIIQTASGDYIFSGISASSDGILTSNHGLYDVWLLKISDTGP